MDAIKEYECRAAEVEAIAQVPPASSVVGREGYGWIAFKGLPNTRDLGGLIGADGRRVKSGLLLRSGALGFARGNDLERLRDEYNLRLVVDLRNDEELSELPDPMDVFPGAVFLHASILASETAGITQETGAQELARLKREIDSENDPVTFMAALYPYLLLGHPGLEGYRDFFRALLACEEGAALWHCYVGRDRCGLASVLVETALGVDYGEIERDYIATNAYAPRELTEHSPANLVMLHAAVDAVSHEYGSMLGYINDALGVTPSEIGVLRERYLEPLA